MPPFLHLPADRAAVQRGRDMLSPSGSGRPSSDGPYRAALRTLRRGLAAAVGFSAVINVLMLTGSVYMLQVYDRVLASRSVPTLLGLFAIVVVLYGFLALYDALRSRLMARAAVRLDRAVGAEAFACWTSPAQVGGRPGRRGDEQAPAQPLRDLDAVRGFLSGPAVGALFDLPWVPLYLGALFLVHPTLGWLTIGGAAVAAGLAALNNRLTRDAIARVVAREGEERDHAERVRRGAEVARAMGMLPALAARWQGLRDAALLAGQASGDPAEALTAASRAFRMLLQSAILTAGAWLVIRGEITGGMIIASSILSGRALAPVDQIIGNWRAIRRAALAHAALDRLFAQVPPTPARLRLPAPTGRLDVAGLSRFARRQGQADESRPLLDGVSFSLDPGDGLGIIGPSGGGKSTLARLLVGALDADRGEVRLDGATLDQWEPAHLGRHVGYLPQAPDPLAGSVRDLVARFDPGIPDEDVIAAARLAGIHDMILALPEGYATLVGGEGGHVLSGGQAQRLGLARAVCGRPRLVVLDEPNAHLDAQGDEALARAVTELRASGSVVAVVAHRPSALAAVNKLLVLDGGRASRFGDKDEVLGPRLAALRPAGRAALARSPSARSLAGPASSGKPLPDRPRPGSSAAQPPPRAVAERMQRLADLRETRTARRSSAPAAVPAPPPGSAPASPGPVHPGPVHPGPVQRIAT